MSKRSPDERSEIRDQLARSPKPLSAIADPFFVMPGFMQGIHDLTQKKLKDVDGRDKPGHDVLTS